MTATYSFLPWVRLGIVGAIKDEAVVDALSVEVSVSLEGAQQPATVTVRVHGPGSVTGVERGAIVRTSPRSGSTDFEPNLFPAIDLSRADFPWLLTPAGVGDTAGGVAPWLVLVVVEQKPGVTSQPAESGRLAVLTIRSPALPAEELPPLGESWAWAHTQVVSSATLDAPALDALVLEDDVRVISRLLCPRRLAPNTRYLACLVPAWSAGVETGLGRDVTSPIMPAWPSPPPARVDLPTYHQWEFSTGSNGDFAALAQQLEARELPDSLGRRELDISSPGLGITPMPGTVVGLEGAIEKIGASPTAWPAPARETFQQELRTVLGQVLSVDAPMIGPPVYGSSATAVGALDDQAALWVRELNLDPRNRAAAGLGEAVVREHQEELASQAWQQLGEIERVEAMLERSQLADLVGARLHARHVATATATSLLQLTRPAHARLAVARTGQRPQTVGAFVASSALTGGAITASFRRLTRPAGPIARRTGASEATVAKMIRGLDSRTLEPMPAQVPPNGAAVLDDVSAAVSAELGRQVRFELATVTAIRAAAQKWKATVPRRPDRLDRPDRRDPPGRPHSPGRPIPIDRPLARDVPAVMLRRAVDDVDIPELPDEVEPGHDPVDTIDMFRSAAEAHQHYLIDVLNALPPRRRRPALFASATATAALHIEAVVEAMQPRRMLIRDLAARVPGLLLDPGASNPFAARRHEVEFETATYEWLRALEPESILPGLADIKPESVNLLQTDRRFVESFMIGLNEALGAELRWRRFPAERSGTFFRSFWKQGVPDIPRLGDDAWRTAALGEHAMRPDPVLFLIRGALVARYPNAVITAVPAVLGANGRSPAADAPIPPVFQVTLEPDILIAAFELGSVNEDVLRGESGNPAKPGWYFVIQEHPTEPRFGLDARGVAGGDPAAITSWRKLSWGHFAGDEVALAALHHVPLAGRVADHAPAADGVPWGRDAGDMAFITLRRPASIAFHASQLLRK